MMNDFAFGFKVGILSTLILVAFVALTVFY